MLHAIGMALAKAAPDALAVNLGQCTGSRVLRKRVQAALLSTDCQVLENFGPCTHAWATTPAHAQQLLGIIQTDACRLPVDIIMAEDSHKNRYQHILCPNINPSHADTFSDNMVRQCGSASIIRGT
jgi:GR25 family glycosyltransferase involved in LPS biosynthesis